MNIYTFDNARKEFFNIIKSVNQDSKEIYIAPNEIGEKGAVLIGEADWNTIQETLFLLEKRITNQIKHRKNEEILDFESTWDNL
ncbi:type II toxin-antitoxin system Phd/YefM family antitoxin [Macrococcus epidermidis]|uniref:type II toxin-antitoxin system Phd/YefM family antitoxin n=1 Tax=Macrococcus epidermidis TaxID=1902580 RepID=UPI0020B70A29|nr:type II toxin-antitoxin system Phd/YefM family antitoxin [Macrococcus epidermidis]UTH15079.1 type II toxin-antitoxin system Phd/YefM family antitoxin [Macrococcus epidermidis]